MLRQRAKPHEPQEQQNAEPTASMPPVVDGQGLGAEGEARLADLAQELELPEAQLVLAEGSTNPPPEEVAPPPKAPKAQRRLLR